MAQDVAEESDGDLAKDLRAANEEIAKGDVNGQHIPSYVPTRQIKTFHPRSPGMVAYRDGIIETINRVQVNTAASGTCKLAITEIWTCEPVEKNLYARINLTGADGKVIYTTQRSVHSPGVPINDAFPLKLKEDGMSETLTVIGEHTNDYIQFHYGSTSWTSGTNDGKASCQLNGDDWNKNGPQGCPAPAIVSFIDVQFPRQYCNKYANEPVCDRLVALIANIHASFLYLVLKVVYENGVYGRVLLLLLRRTKIPVYIFFKSVFDLNLNRSRLC